MSRKLRGFSLIELMITVALIAILVTLSYPSYANFIRKSHRSEALMDLLDWANRQQIWRADNTSYSASIDPTDSDYYTYTIVASANAFTLTATAKGKQADDSEADVTCATLTLDQDGTRGPVGHEKCWRKN